ncbi:MAG: DEAD/DEAH box helicase [Candidatus Heimdallarchaeota archaeon]|nr:DEAD/DEAH box helicase [Candidatus Heimdallarchaeota archaeon]
MRVEAEINSKKLLRKISLINVQVNTILNVKLFNALFQQLIKRELKCNPMNIQDLNLPSVAQQLIINRGIQELYPPQAEAIKAGLLAGENIVLAIPTASGKTLVAELAMLRSILVQGGKALYLVPLKALAAEKNEEFSEYQSLGIKVIQSTGDFDSNDYRLGNYDLIICTNEKVDSLLRHDVAWVNDISVIVVDEVHLIDDSHRGPTLEVVLARLKRILPTTQILALSATINNADEIAEWLEAKLIQSDWRPVKLSEGVYWDGFVEFTDGRKLRIPKKVSRYPEIDIAYDTIKKQGQLLVFANTRVSSQAAARRIGKGVYKLFPPSEKRQLAELSERILAVGEKTSLSERLAKAVKRGVAFHHAGLAPDHRKLIEDNFRENIIKCVCATPTLAAGVNLPARRVVIKSLTRYEVGVGSKHIRVLEYKQQAGRAGRPKYDTSGESIIIAKSARDQTRYLERYCLGEPEMIWSKLASETALRSHILAAIAIGYVANLTELAHWIQETFFGYQNDISQTEWQVKKVLRFLLDEGLIENQGPELWATKFGARVSQLYIDPLSAIIIRDGLRLANGSDIALKEFSYFQLIASSPDLRGLFLRKKDQKEIAQFVMDNEHHFITEVPEQWAADFEYFMMSVKTALLLQSWIEEQPEDTLIDKFNIGSGDILYITDSAKWLLYAAKEIAKLFDFKKVAKPLRELHLRVAHGIRKELVKLVKLKGIGRVRGRMLYNAGYKTIKSLKEASPRELVKIPTIGIEVVRSIKKQVGAPLTDQELKF